jgi:hypothetical protein
MSDHGAQLLWKGQLGTITQPTLSTFPVGGNRGTLRKLTTFGRASTDSFHTYCTVVNRRRLWNSMQTYCTVVNRRRLWNSMQTYCTVVNRRLWNSMQIYSNKPLYLCFCLGLCKKWSVHRHVCIVFSPEQPIAMFSFNHCVISRLGN